MIKKTFLFIFLFFSFYGFSQKVIEKTLNSDFVDTDRKIKIYLTKGYDPDAEKYSPLAIDLDETTRRLPKKNKKLL